MLQNPLISFNFMFAAIPKSCFLAAVLFTAVFSVGAQTDASGDPIFGRRDPKADEVKTVKDMLAKQRTLRDKKDHEEMLKRGEEAAILSQQLESAFEQKKQLSGQDIQKLESLEKIVTKIRRELGGDDDDEDDVFLKERKPSTLREAFDSLHITTLKLADELKKTSRFSISALAIQTSNSVLKLVKFLRLRK